MVDGTEYTYGGMVPYELIATYDAYTGALLNVTVAGGVSFGCVNAAPGVNCESINLTLCPNPLPSP
jgi:hypothetical protein